MKSNIKNIEFVNCNEGISDIAYNSYFFRPEDTSLSIFEKMRMHGDGVVESLDGGSACHLNLEEHLSKEQYLKTLDYAAQVGCNYVTFNIPSSRCGNCEHQDINYWHSPARCPKCGSDNIDYCTRVVGYHRWISSWQNKRQIEGRSRHNHKIEGFSSGE